MENILLKLFGDNLLIDIKLNNTINNIINNQYPSNINIINKYNITTINNNTHVKNITNNPFIPEIILDYIKNKLKLQYSYINNELDINFFSKNNIDKILLDDIHSIIYFINTIFNNKKKIKINIFLTPFKKEFKKVYDADAINSGSTNRVTITLWREEEIRKVLIHELIHYLHIDLKDDSIIASKLLNKINMCENCQIRPNEAYTELIAIQLYILWYNKFKYKNFDYNNFNIMMNNELKWSIYQCAKILNSFNCFEKFEDILDKSKNCKITQYTNMISYFILKTILLFNINDFCECIINKVNNESFNFYDSEQNYNKFYKFIIKCLGNNEFNNIINNIMQNLKNNPELFLPTMRMSLFG